MRSRRSWVMSGKVIGPCFPSMKRLGLQPSSAASGSEFARQRVSPLGDAACAQADDIVAGLSEAAHQACQLIGIGERQHVAVAVRLDGGHEMIAIGTRDGGLAGRI